MKSSFQQFIAAVKELRDSLLDIPKKLSALDQDLKDQTKAVREVRDAYEVRRESAPTIQANLQAPPFLEVETSPKDKKQIREWCKLAIEALTLLAVIWYACEAHRQWSEMHGTLVEAKKQTVYLHDQLVGTQQAILVLDLVNQTGNDDPQTGPFFGFDVSVVNNGHIATWAHVVLKVGRKNLPSLDNLGISESITWDIPQIPATSEDGHQKVRPFRTLALGITPQTWVAMQNFTKTDTVYAEGEITFDNGFGDNIRLPFCKIFYAHPTIVNSGQNAWIPCDEYRENLTEWKDRERRAARENK